MQWSQNKGLHQNVILMQSPKDIFFIAIVSLQYHEKTLHLSRAPRSYVHEPTFSSERSITL